MLVSIIVIFFNVTCMVIQILADKLNKTFSSLVISINLNDLLCGIYLACIWISNILMKDKFMAKEEIWRSGLVYFVSFGISLWFSHLNPIFTYFPFSLEINACNSSHRHQV